MSVKNILSYPIATNQSLTTTFTTKPTVINWLDNISYQITITTTNSIGTFTLQASTDYEINQPGTGVLNAGTWSDLTLGGGAPFANAANDDIIIDLNQVPFRAIRIKYTASTPGTGTCTILFMGKRLG